MAERKNSTRGPIHFPSLSKRMLLGAAIALILIVVFLSQAGEPDPAWPRLWMVRPLIIVPLAGATGGGFFYFMDHLSYQGGWKKAGAYILSAIVYIIGLWMGTVLGLDGTHWD
jgi:hypothetical protein